MSSQHGRVIVLERDSISSQFCHHSQTIFYSQLHDRRDSLCLCCVYHKQQSSTQTQWRHQNHCSDSFWTLQSKIDQNITVTSKHFQHTQTYHNMKNITVTSTLFKRCTKHNRSRRSRSHHLVVSNMILLILTTAHASLSENIFLKFGLKHVSVKCFFKFFYTIFLGKVEM